MTHLPRCMADPYTARNSHQWRLLSIAYAALGAQHVAKSCHTKSTWAKQAELQTTYRKAA